MEKLVRFVTQRMAAEVQEEGLVGFIEGRQGSGYWKKDVRGYFRHDRVITRCFDWLTAKLDVALDGYDAWILKYPVGSFIDEHVDALDKWEHHRINILVQAGVGGELTVNGLTVELEVGDAYYFRPDVERHAVGRVTLGERIVFSVGVRK